jgi:glycine/D-amino acid oxidase-like deaminating enzyme
MLANAANSHSCPVTMHVEGAWSMPLSHHVQPPRATHSLHESASQRGHSLNHGTEAVLPNCAYERVLYRCR